MKHSELSALLDHWPVGTLLSAQRPSSGATNDVQIVTTDQGKYVLIIFNEQTMQSLPWMLHLQQQLNFSGVMVAEPLPSKRAALVVEVQHKAAALFSFLEGRAANNSAADCFAAGQTLAKLHAYRGNHEHRPNPVDATQMLIELQQLSLPAAQRQFIEAKISEYRQLYKLNLPINLIHADFFIDNAIVLADGQMAVIDWEYCCHDLAIYDLAISLNAWCADAQTGERNESLEHAMLQGYQSLRGLQPNEQQALPIARQHAVLRFWIRRMLKPNGKSTAALWHLLQQFEA